VLPIVRGGAHGLAATEPGGKQNPHKVYVKHSLGDRYWYSRKTCPLVQSQALNCIRKRNNNPAAFDEVASVAEIVKPANPEWSWQVCCFA